MQSTDPAPIDPPVVVVPVKTPGEVSQEALLQAKSGKYLINPEVITLDEEPSKEGFVRRIGAFFGFGEKKVTLDQRIEIREE